MIYKVTIFLAVFAVSALLGVTSVLAHIHPLVPADECASGRGAGNTAQPQNGDNGNPPVPGLIFINVPAPLNPFAPNSGVGPATDHCAKA